MSQEVKRVGRPSIEEPRQTRGVRLTVKEWATFQAVGGSNWLREKLEAVKLTPTQKQARDDLVKKLGGQILLDLD